MLSMARLDSLAKESREQEAEGWEAPGHCFPTYTTTALAESVSFETLQSMEDLQLPGEDSNGKL